MAKRGIQYVQQDEPSFIKQFKKQVAYKEGPTVDTKVKPAPDWAIIQVSVFLLVVRKGMKTLSLT